MNKVAVALVALLAIAVHASLSAAVGDISTVAGGDVGDGLPATSAPLYVPSDVAVDSAGNLFIADTSNHRIRKVDATTGVITTVAGIGTYGTTGDGGPATSAQLLAPLGVAVDGAGNLFITTANDRIRKVDATTGVITTVAGSILGTSGDGGPATSAQIAGPRDVAVDSAGNLFIADSYNHRIRKVDATTAVITTVAGSGYYESQFGSGFGGDGGPATGASINYPAGVAIDSVGNLFIADTDNQRIRRVDATTGVITSVAGSGSTFFGGFSGDGTPATSAQLNFPSSVAVDSAGNLFIGDKRNNRVRKVDTTTGVITTVAGSGPGCVPGLDSCGGFSGDGGPATSALLGVPSGIAVDSAGNLFIADSYNNRIRKVDVTTGVITTVAGSSGDGGPASTGQLKKPVGVAVDSAGNLFIADIGNNRIRKVNAATGLITTVAGSGPGCVPNGRDCGGFAGDGGPATSALLGVPSGVAVDSAGNLFIADTRNNRVRKVDATTGVITTVAGSAYGFAGDGGPAISALLKVPSGVAVDSAGNLFIADSYNNRIRKVDATTGIITTAAGSTSSGFSGGGGDGGPATSAHLWQPYGVAVDGAGNLFIADTLNARIRTVNAATGVITTVAGSGPGPYGGFSGDGGHATSAQLASPLGVAVDSAGNLFIADYHNQRIRKVDATTGVITTVAGSSSYSGFSGDGGPATAAQLYQPAGVALDNVGNLFIADTFNNRIRKVEGVAAASAPSDAVTPSTVPGAPTNVVAVAGNSGATVTWSAPSSDGGSAIYQYTVTSNPDGLTAVVNGSTLSTTVTGLTNGTAYTFTVTAANAVGTGPASAPSDAVTPKGVPGAPTNVVAVAGNSGATVTWSAPSSDGGNAIYQYTVTSNPDGLTAVVNGSTLSTTVIWLTNGTAYTFTVTATNAVGTGPPSNPSAAVRPRAPIIIPALSPWSLGVLVLALGATLWGFQVAKPAWKSR